MRAVILIGFVVSIGFATARATSQTTAPEGTIHTQIEGINIPSVVNAPFTAKVLVTWDEPLVGGGTVSRKYYTLVARDSQGRVHREIRDFIPAGSNAEPHLRSVIITDPISSTRTTCTQDVMKCTVLDFHPLVDLTELSGNAIPSHTSRFSQQSLGEQTMNSISVVGTRETSTTVAGTGGNTRVLISSKDLWYSPDLKMYLSVIRKDPQLGQITLTVTDLLRGEPDPTWFGVLPGYTVVNARSNQSAVR